MRTRTIDVEINSNSLRILRYKQYDHNNTLEVILRKNKEIVDLTSYTIRVFFTLPNKKVIQRNAVFKDKKIVITIESILLENPGKIPIEITMSNGKEVVTIFTMLLEVEESIDRNASIIGNPQWDIIKDGLSVLDDKVSHDELNTRIKECKEDVNEELDNYYTKEEIDTSLNGNYTKEDINEILNSYYTKVEITKSLNNYYTKNKIDTTLEDYPTKDEINVALRKYYTSTETNALLDEYYYTKEEVDEKLDNLDFDIDIDIDSLKDLDCSHVGNELPENDNKIWFSDGVSSAGDGITYDNPLIQELFACINTLQSQIQKLQEEVDYLKLHGGGTGGSDTPGGDITDGNYLLLEDGTMLLLEDGDNFLLESDDNKGTDAIVDYAIVDESIVCEDTIQESA